MKMLRMFILYGGGSFVVLVAFCVWLLIIKHRWDKESEAIHVDTDQRIAALNAKRHAEEEAQYRTKRWAFGECLRYGGVPVMSFGPAITCVLSPLFSSWVIGLDDPPGIKRHPDGVAWDKVWDENDRAHCFDVGAGVAWAPVKEKACQ